MSEHDLTYSQWLADRGIWTQTHPWTPRPNYPGRPNIPWTADPGYAPVSTTPNTWQSAMVQAPGTLRMLRMAQSRIQQHGMSGSVQMGRAGWNDMTSERLRLPGMLNVAIRNGEASPIGPPPYTGPYPTTASVPAPGLFQVYPGVMGSSLAPPQGTPSYGETMVQAALNNQISAEQVGAEARAWAEWLERFVGGATDEQISVISRRADVLVAVTMAVTMACSEIVPRGQAPTKCLTMEEVVAEGRALRGELVASGYLAADVDAAIDAIVAAVEIAGLSLDQSIRLVDMTAVPTLTSDQVLQIENVFEVYLLGEAQAQTEDKSGIGTVGMVALGAVAAFILLK